VESNTGNLELGSVVAGYRIGEVISRGGMGVVFRARNIALNRIYALKVLKPEYFSDEQYRERFRREMRIAASLHHPNVVGIHYAGEHEGLLFLVMDFVYGTDLRRLLYESRALEPERAVEFLTQLASALNAAHSKGLVHRDVKPANVLITIRDGEEQVYLTDFGLAKRSDSVDALTQKGVVVGTVDYMAPEQVTGEAIDARTDIYALGCTFFHMLTGKVPYERENSIATLFAHVHEPPPPFSGALAELYPTFGAVIEKAMAKDPSDRYTSAGDFARDAVAALGGGRYTGPETVVAIGDASLVRSNIAIVSQPAPAPDTTVPTPQTTIGRLGSQPAPATATASGHASAASGTAEKADAETFSTPEPGASGGPRAVSTPDHASARSRRGGLATRYRWTALAGFVIIAGAVAVVLALRSNGSSTGSARQENVATLRAVPTNHVTGSGTATVRLKGNVATVTVDTHGLLDAVHLMHIHGGSGNCPARSAAQVVNGHRFISGDVGTQIYGPVAASLTQDDHPTSPQYHLDSSLYARGQNIHYQRTFTLAPGVAGQILDGLAVVVVHGIDYDGKDVYDNVLGPGQEAQAPALCGPLEPAQVTTATASQNVGSRFFVASLELYGTATTDESVGAPLLLCHVEGTPTPASPQQTADEVRVRLPT